jgi:G3E family GTPase
LNSPIPHHVHRSGHDGRIPVTILTGFLGSGKTTLLKRILMEHHGERIAVIENEFGEVGVDDRLLLGYVNAEVATLSNGCICCSARDGLVHALVALNHKRDAGSIEFERVIIETTGLADALPLTHLFVGASPVRDRYRLDAIITIVDALHGGRQLDTFHEAQGQVAIADVILISKADLVTIDEAARLAQRVAAMNPHATIGRVRFGTTGIDAILDCAAFDATPRSYLPSERPGATHHDDTARVRSFAFCASRPFAPARLDAFLSAIVDLYGPDLLRCKGVLDFDGYDLQVVIQGVQTVLNVEAGPPWPLDEPRRSSIVFIGADLPKAMIVEGLEACLAPQETAQTICAANRDREPWSWLCTS